MMGEKIKSITNGHAIDEFIITLIEKGLDLKKNLDAGTDDSGHIRDLMDSLRSMLDPFLAVHKLGNTISQLFGYENWLSDIRFLDSVVEIVLTLIPDHV